MLIVQMSLKEKEWSDNIMATHGCRLQHDRGIQPQGSDSSCQYPALCWFVVCVSVLGKIRSAVGSAQLLMSQKFQQFYWLCQQNLVRSPSQSVCVCVCVCVLHYCTLSYFCDYSGWHLDIIIISQVLSVDNNRYHTHLITHKRQLGAVILYASLDNVCVWRAYNKDTRVERSFKRNKCQRNKPADIFTIQIHIF